MKKYCRLMGFFLILLMMFQTGFSASVSKEERSGRSEENPVALLILEEGLYVAFREPGRVVRYDNEWNELETLDLPGNFLPAEMIESGESIWILDEKNDLILQIDPVYMQIVQTIGTESPQELTAIFESEGVVLVLDEEGHLQLVNESFEIQGLMTGLKMYQSAFYDGYQLYLGGRVEPRMSGVLVKSLENKLIDEWLMSDDSRAPTDVDTVEQIRLLSDGFFYVVYLNTGIVKYDEYGNYRNRIYQRSGEERIFRDIAIDLHSGIHYLVDQSAGIFELAWINDRRISVKKDVVDTSRIRFSSKTSRKVMSARIGEGRLASYYGSGDLGIKMLMPTRNVEWLKLRISASDLIDAQAQAIEWMEVQWKEEIFLFQISEWVLELREGNAIEDQYVEIMINPEESRADFCWIERLDEITKIVRRENLE